MRRGARILVSGAGVAGLACATWLGRNGLRPLVVERSTCLRADGFLVSLSHESYRQARQLGLTQRLHAMATDFAHASYHDRGGRTMLEMNREGLFSQVDIVQIMRDDLQHVLGEAAGEVAELRFATTISSIEPLQGAVGVQFSDGRSGEFDVVVGADGLHSATRALAFPPELVNRRYLGLVSCAYRLPNVLGLEARFENHMERSRYMCVYTARGGGLACVFIWRSDARAAPEPARRRATLHAAFDGAPPIVRRVLEQCPRDQILYQDPLIQIDLARWHQGRVVLLGDAAHGLTLLSGQGASCAFWGASALARALLRAPPEQAFAEYEAVLRPVVQRLAPMTRRAARWYVPHARLAYLVRNAAMHCLPSAVFEGYFRRKYSTA